MRKSFQHISMAQPTEKKSAGTLAAYGFTWKKLSMNMHEKSAILNFYSTDMAPLNFKGLLLQCKYYKKETQPIG